MPKWIALLVFLSLMGFAVAQDAPIVQAVPVGTAGDAAKSAAGAEEIHFTGKVLDSAGAPAVDAKVSAYANQRDPVLDLMTIIPLGETTAGADGGFALTVRFKPVNSRSGILITARKEGVGLDAANWSTGNATTISLALWKPGTLSGMVVDEADKPLAGAEVHLILMIPEGKLLPGIGPLDWLCVKSDAQGGFSFRGVPAVATADLLVAAPGRTTTLAGMREWRGSKLKFQVGQADIKIVLRPDARIEGTVLDKTSRKPVAGVRLAATPGFTTYRGVASFIGVSGADGAFQIRGLPVGQVTLRVIGSGDAPAEWVAGPLALAATTGDAGQKATVEVSRGGLLDVVVTDQNTDAPVPGVTVRGFSEVSDTYTASFTGVTDKNGVARFRLNPGSATVQSLQCEGYQPLRQRMDATIIEARTEHIDAKLTPLAKAVGVVRDPEGKPVAGAEIRVLPYGGTTRTDEAGKFSASSAIESRGNAQLLVRHVERNLAVLTDFAEDDQGMDIRLESAGTVSGKVVAPDGKPIAKATINVLLAAARMYSPVADNVATGADGAFRVQALPPGSSYRLMALADGYGRADASVSLEDAARLTVTADDITLETADQTVSGIVVDADEKPVRNALVRAYGRNQPSVSPVKSDADGRFVIKNVCKGDLEVEVQTVDNRSGTASRPRDETGELKVVVTQTNAGMPRVSRALPSLKNKTLPPLGPLGVDLPADQLKGKMILLCVFDMDQRPSRRCISQLVQRADELKKQDIAVILVQATPTAADALKTFADANKVSYPISAVKEKPEDVLRKFGAASLPWLILTDRNHTVRAEGFGVDELDERIKAVGEAK
jgi:hypothetical protein